MTDLTSLSRLDALAEAELTARGELSADELLSSCFAGIEALNPLLRAVVEVAHTPPPAAEGPLPGVPFLVKDALPWR